MVATYNITIERIINNEIKQAADHTNSFRDVEGDILTNDVHSLPIPESVILQAISELTDGAKLAVETCYDLWKEQKFGTEEFISFIKCYSSQSSTLALVFKDGSQNPETSASSTGGSVDAMTGCSSDTFSSSLEATDKGRLSASKKQKDSSGSSPQTAGSDSDKGSNEKGYMASASESNGHSSNGHSSNGCESGNSSNGHGSSSHGSGSTSGGSSGSDSAGKDNSPTNEDLTRVVVSRPKRSSSQRSLRSNEASNSVSITNQELSKKGQEIDRETALRKRQANSETSKGKDESTSQSGKGNKHSAPCHIKRPRQGVEALFEWKRTPITEESESTQQDCEAAFSKSFGEAEPKDSDGKVKMAMEHRWVPGMQMDKDGMPFMSSTSGSESSSLDLQNRWSSKLAISELGEVLTTKANTAAGCSNVTVRVLSNVEKRLSLGKLDKSLKVMGDESARGEVVYMNKAVFAFQHVKGADVVIFGMYVNEYWANTAPNYAGRVYVECFDSPPVWPGLPGAERHAILTAIMQGYIDFAASNGFKFMHLHVPPPQDATKYIFVQRSLNFRLRVTMHLSCWYKRMLESATALGLISSYHCGFSSDDAPQGLIDVRRRDDKETSNSAILAEGVGSASWQCKHGCFNERFFVAGLRPGRGSLQDTSPVMPNKIVGSRLDCCNFIKEKGLQFHTLSHAQYATMVLVHCIASEQRSYGFVDTRTSTPLHGSSLVHQSARRLEGSKRNSPFQTWWNPTQTTQMTADVAAGLSNLPPHPPQWEPAGAITSHAFVLVNSGRGRSDSKVHAGISPGWMGIAAVGPPGVHPGHSELMMHQDGRMPMAKDPYEHRWSLYNPQVSSANPMYTMAPANMGMSIPIPMSELFDGHSSPAMGLPPDTQQRAKESASSGSSSSSSEKRQRKKTTNRRKTSNVQEAAAAAAAAAQVAAAETIGSTSSRKGRNTAALMKRHMLSELQDDIVVEDPMLCSADDVMLQCEELNAPPQMVSISSREGMSLCDMEASISSNRDGGLDSAMSTIQTVEDGGNLKSLDVKGIDSHWSPVPNFWS